jgi:hypothetical protein
MTDVDLHPLPITPNDPLSIFSNRKNFFVAQQSKIQHSTPSTNDDMFDMEILDTEDNKLSMFGSALPSLKISTKPAAAIPKKNSLRNMDLSGEKVILEMPEWTKQEIMENNLANLKLQNRLS